MEELRPGLWWWTAPHPEWKPEDGTPTGWERDVSCYAVETGDGLVLVDPLSPPPELAARATAAIITCEWHLRSSRELGVPVWEPTRGGDTPAGVEPRATAEAEEVAFWIPEHGALVIGDAVSAEGDTLRVNWTWVPEGIDRAAVERALRPLLDLPVELVLPGHGPPVREGGRDALAAALGR